MDNAVLMLWVLFCLPIMGGASISLLSPKGVNYEGCCLFLSCYLLSSSSSSLLLLLLMSLPHFLFGQWPLWWQWRIRWMMSRMCLMGGILTLLIPVLGTWWVALLRVSSFLCKSTTAPVSSVWLPWKWNSAFQSVGCRFIVYSMPKSAEFYYIFALNKSSRLLTALCLAWAYREPFLPVLGIWVISVHCKLILLLLFFLFLHNFYCKFG